jgi:hypothetical protein
MALVVGGRKRLRELMQVITVLIRRGSASSTKTIQSGPQGSKMYGAENALTA